jgi:carbon starvation protein
MAEMNRIVINDRIDAALCALFMVVVVATALFGVVTILRARKSPGTTTHEMGLDAEVAHA